MLEKNVPDYYPAMYQDGYTPTQILFAMRQKMRQEAQERQNAGLSNVHFTIETKVKKMKIDNTGREKNKKKEKKQQSQLEAMIFSVIRASVKATVDEAMKELFKDFK